MIEGEEIDDEESVSEFMDESKPSEIFNKTLVNNENYEPEAIEQEKEDS